MSNSNFNITKVTVDPVSQEISSLEINGKPIETGGEANLEEVIFDEDNPLNVASIFGERTIPVQIYPSGDYDGIEQITIQPNGLTGYPTPPEHLFVRGFVECDSEGEVVTGGHTYNGSITDAQYGDIEAKNIYINNTKISFTSKKIVVEVPGGKDTSYFIYYWDYEGEWIMMS